MLFSFKGSAFLSPGSVAKTEVIQPMRRHVGSSHSVCDSAQVRLSPQVMGLLRLTPLVQCLCRLAYLECF